MTNSIETVAARLAEWRENRPSVSARIPADIWDDAVGLAKQIGVAKAAVALRVGYTDLKRRVERKSQSTSCPTSFVEVVSSGLEPLGECALEVTSSSGSTIRVAMKSPTPGGLAALICNLA